jgi:hypothetical protein
VLNMDSLASTASVTTHPGLNEKASYSSTKTRKEKVVLKPDPAAQLPRKRSTHNFKRSNQWIDHIVSSYSVTSIL